MGDNVDVRSWDSPWTPREIRENNYPWSLAGDAGMFHFVKDTSNNFTSKVLETQSTFEALGNKSNALISRLDNAFNDFQMLSNTQFLENRIEEESVDKFSNQSVESSKAAAVKNPSKEEKEELLKTTFKKCLLESLKTFGHTNHNANSSPQEDESGGSNLFEHRPTLPFIIGSSEFISSSTAGITIKRKVIEKQKGNKEESSGVGENSTIDSNSTREQSQTVVKEPNTPTSEDEDLFPQQSRTFRNGEEDENANQGVAIDENGQSDQVPASMSSAPRNTSGPKTIILSPPNLDSESSSSEDEGALFSLKPQSKPRTQKLTITSDDNSTTIENMDPKMSSSTDVNAMASVVKELNVKNRSDHQESVEEVEDEKETVDSDVELPPPPPQNNIESSSEDSDVDIFKPATSKHSATASKTAKTEEFSRQSQSVNVAPTQTNVAQTRPNYMSMFEESSDDEDDGFLFKLPKANKKPGLFSNAEPASKTLIPSEQVTANPESVEDADVALPTKNAPEESTEADTLEINIPKTDSVVPDFEAQSSTKDSKNIVDDDSDSDDGFPNKFSNSSQPQNRVNPLDKVFGGNLSDSDDDSSLFSRSTLPIAQKKDNSTVLEVKTKADSAKFEEPLQNEDIHVVAGSDSKVNTSATVPADKDRKSKPLMSQSSDDNDLFSSTNSKLVTQARRDKQDAKNRLQVSSDESDGELFQKHPKSNAVLAKSKDDNSANETATSKDTKPIVNYSSFLPISVSSDSDNELFKTKTEKSSDSKSQSNPLEVKITKDVASVESEDESLNVMPPLVRTEERKVISTETKSIVGNQQSVQDDVSGKSPLDIFAQNDDNMTAPDAAKTVKHIQPKGRVAQLGKNLNLTASMIRRPGMVGIVPKDGGSTRSSETSSTVSTASIGGAVTSPNSGTGFTDISKSKSKIGPKRRPPTRPGRVPASTSAQTLDIVVPTTGDAKNDSGDVLKEPEQGKKPDDKFDVDIFADSLRIDSKDAVLNSSKSQIGANSNSSSKMEQVTNTNEVDIFAESIGPNDIKVAPVPQLPDTTASSKKKKGTAGKAKSKVKKGAVSSKATANEKKPADDSVFNTPEDIFDD